MTESKLIMRWIIYFVAVLSSSTVSAKTEPGYDWAVRNYNDAWRQECSICHMAYLPKMLSANNWRQIMQGLDRHFGSNASLETRVRDEITAYLVAHASSDSNGMYSAETLRISNTPWFLTGHGLNASRFWGKRQVGSAANCTACHKGTAFM